MIVRVVVYVVGVRGKRPVDIVVRLVVGLRSVVVGCGGVRDGGVKGISLRSGRWGRVR